MSAVLIRRMPGWASGVRLHSLCVHLPLDRRDALFAWALSVVWFICGISHLHILCTCHCFQQHSVRRYHRRTEAMTASFARSTDLVESKSEHHRWRFIISPIVNVASPSRTFNRMGTRWTCEIISLNPRRRAEVGGRLRPTSSFTVQHHKDVRLRGACANSSALSATCCSFRLSGRLLLCCWFFCSSFFWCIVWAWISCSPQGWRIGCDYWNDQVVVRLGLNRSLAIGSSLLRH